MATMAEAFNQASGAVSSSMVVAAQSTAAPERTKPEVNSDRRERYWLAIEWLPVQISICLPIPRFRVRDLLALDPGQMLATNWPNGDDLPLSVDQVQLAWVEMESVEQEMAVRITRLL